MAGKGYFLTSVDLEETGLGTTEKIYKISLFIAPCYMQIH